MSVQATLENLGLERYLAAFKTNHISDERLDSITDEELETIGVASADHRRLILRAVSARCPDWLAALPSVIALPPLEWLRERNSTLRLWAACDTVELLLRFAVMSALADRAAHADPRYEETIRRLRPSIEEPTLGRWKAMAVAVVPEQGASSCVPELRALVSDIVELIEPDGDRRSPAQSMLSLRNRLAHGGGITKTIARSLLQRWEPRIDALLQSIRWMQSIELVVRIGPDDYGVLRGPTPAPSAWTPRPELRTGLESSFRTGEEILLVRDSSVLTLWPLSAFAPARGAEAIQARDASRMPQVYIRRTELSLQYNPIGADEVAQSEASDAALEAFITFFRLREAREESGGAPEIRGFEDDIARDAGRLIGREDALRIVAESVRNASDGVLWLTGPAGIGKSYLVARFVQEWLDSPPDGTILLPYRFKSGDDRCASSIFLRFVTGRLLRFLSPEKRAKLQRDSGRMKPIMLMRSVMAELIRDGHKLVLVIDGVDEIAESEPDFVERVPMSMRMRGLVWVCAGRPDGGLDKAFDPSRCVHVFPGGLPRMGVSDVRAMLIERIGTRRRRLISNDLESDGEVINPFVDKVAACADGLPIYVKYVIGDILSGRLRMLDATEQVPPSLAQYHEEMLRRCGIGALHQVLTPLVSLLAVSLEPLDEAVIGEMLRAADLADDTDLDSQIVRTALGAVGSMIRAATTPEGNAGYTLFHKSLRDHMASSPTTRGAVATARKRLCRMARDGEAYSTAAGPYLFRQGITHLVDAGKIDVATRLLTSFDHLMHRLERLPLRAGPYGISADWRLVASRSTLDDIARQFEHFLRTREYLLLMADARCRPDRILLQIASFHARLGDVAQAACKWRSEHRPAWPRFELSDADLPDEPAIDACLGVLSGHTDTVNALAFTRDHSRIVSGSGNRFDDFTVRLWDARSHECLRVMTGHRAPVTAVCASRDGKTLVSSSYDGTLRVWDGESGACPLVFEEHEGRVHGARLSADAARVLSGGDDGILREWDVRTGAVLRTCNAGAPVSCLACDEAWRVALVGLQTGAVVQLDLSSMQLTPTREAHEGAVICAQVAADGLSGVTSAAGGSVIVWDLLSGAPKTRWEVAPDDASSLAYTPDGTRMLVGCCGGGVRDVFDRSIGIWSIEHASRIGDLTGHCDFLNAVAVSEDGSTAISGGGDYGIRVWDLTQPSPTSNSRADSLVWVASIAFSSDAKSFITASDDATVRIWDTESRACARIMRTTRHDTVRQAVFTADEKLIVSASEDGRVRVWWREDGEIAVEFTGHQTGVNTVCVGPEGRMAFSGDGDHEGRNCVLRCWDLATLEQVWAAEGDWGDIAQVSTSPDGRLLVTVDWGGALRVRNALTGDELFALDTGTRLLRAVALSPDGRQAVCSDSAGAVQLWDLRSRRLVRRFDGHGYDVRKVAFSPDGQLLFTVSDDQSVRAWDVSTAEPVAAAFFDSWIVSIGLQSLGRIVAVGTSDGRIAMMNLVGAPEPRASIVTPVRVWQYFREAHRTEPSGKWADELSVQCPSCGVRAPIQNDSTDDGRSDGGESAILTLPDEAWDFSGRAMACHGCGHALQINPFFVDGSR